MTIATLFRYLSGDREAIWTIARARGALLLGALLVLSAGFAREYDAQDLLRRPWYLIVPLLASTGTSWLLYSLIYLISRRRSVERFAYWSTYRSFLALYWMTAPLAWLYALPVERFMSEGDSAQANIALLAIVSVWRVSLMIRVATVYFGANLGAAMMMVLLFGTTVALAVITFTPLPIFSIMGGIPLTSREAVIAEAKMFVQVFGAPLWLISLVCVMGASVGDRNWQPIPVSGEVARVRPSLWGLATIAVLGWGLVLPFTQPQQRRRSEAEGLLLAGDVQAGMTFMSQHEPQDFPPYWNPPPWLAYSDPRPPILDVMAVIMEKPVAPWVHDLYVERFRQAIRAGGFYYSASWKGDDVGEQDRLLTILEKLPEGRSIAGEAAFSLEQLWRETTDATRKQRIEELLKAAGHPVKEPAVKPAGEFPLPFESPSQPPSPSPAGRGPG